MANTRNGGFNGADVFQRRRLASTRAEMNAALAASMEPTSFNVGDPRNHRNGVSSHLALQWSRRLSTSETVWLSVLSTNVTVASMEPTSFNVGDRLVSHCWRRTSLRFNGADVFQRRRRRWMESK